MKEEYRDYLDDMLRETDLAIEFCRGLDIDGFRNSALRVHAVIRCLEIIGEAANRIPAEVKAAFPGLPWRVMIAMRNRLIHGYEVVDEEIIWNTVTNDLPELRTGLLAILNKLAGE